VCGLNICRQHLPEVFSQRFGSFFSGLVQRVSGYFVQRIRSLLICGELFGNILFLVVPYFCRFILFFSCLNQSIFPVFFSLWRKSCPFLCWRIIKNRRFCFPGLYGVGKAKAGSGSLFIFIKISLNFFQSQIKRVLFAGCFYIFGVD